MVEEISPFSSSAGERKLMAHFMVKSLFSMHVIILKGTAMAVP